MVGLGRLELPTSRLSSARSNQLSYKPVTEDGGRRPTDTRDIAQDVVASRHGPRRPKTEEKETKAAASRMMPSDKA